MNELTPSQQAAAFHGLATNQAMPLHERLSFALTALDMYEAEMDRLRTELAAEVRERTGEHREVTG